MQPYVVISLALAKRKAEEVLGLMISFIGSSLT
jgi:hypothetical protein